MTPTPAQPSPARCSTSGIQPAPAKPTETSSHPTISSPSGFLSVNAKAAAARALLRDHRDEFSEYLAAIGPDRDLADEPGPIDPSWPAWMLDSALRTVRGINLTIASKLIARKRPRLYPIWDNVVVDVLGTRGGPHIEPIHDALRRNPQLRRRVTTARTEAGLPSAISELRILDTIAWMESAG